MIPAEAVNAIITNSKIQAPGAIFTPPIVRNPILRITLTEIFETVQSIFFRGCKKKTLRLQCGQNNLGGIKMDHESLGFYFDFLYYIGVPILIIFVLDTLRKKYNKKEEQS
jgi:hypothetical protein